VKTHHLSIRAKYPMGHQTFQNQKLSMISTTVCGYIMAMKGSVWNHSSYKGLTLLLQFSSSLLQFHVNIIKLQKPYTPKKYIQLPSRSRFLNSQHSSYCNVVKLPITLRKLFDRQILPVGDYCAGKNTQTHEISTWSALNVIMKLSYFWNLIMCMNTQTHKILTWPAAK